MSALRTAALQTSGAERYLKILRLGLPIIGGMVSQNVLNLVDTWMVGKLGTVPLAAVSVGGMLNFLAVASLMGLSAGVQAVAARRHGEGRSHVQARPLNAAILLGLVFGVPLTIAMSLSAPALLRFLHSDESVVSTAIPYVLARLVALVPAGLNFGFRGYWNGVNRSSIYFTTLLVIHGTNIVLNWLLIFGNLGMPELGAQGAGVASALATTAGCILYFAQASRLARDSGFLRTRVDKALLKTVVQLAVPTSIQQLLFAGGMTALFGILGRIGTLETAAGGVLVTVMLVAILPGLGLGITSTSLVSQAIGRGDAEDAYRWGWETAQVAAALGLLLGMSMLIAPRWFLTPFLEDPDALQVAILPLRLFGCGILFDSIGTVLQQSLLGAGANRQVMVVSILCQWGLFLPLAYLLGVSGGLGLAAVWAAQTGYRALQASIYSGLWVRREWENIRL